MWQTLGSLAYAVLGLLHSFLFIGSLVLLLKFSEEGIRARAFYGLMILLLSIPVLYHLKLVIISHTSMFDVFIRPQAVGFFLGCSILAYGLWKTKREENKKLAFSPKLR